MHRIITYISIIILVISSCVSLDAQTIQTPFGKNRVQYHDDFDSWWMYETDNFVTFWYGKGRNIAKSTMQLAELDHDELERILAYSMNDKIRIIIYQDHSDYSQTNISYFDTREAGGAGLAQFYDNKAMVFFNGDHNDLRKQIRAGIVQTYLKSMFTGISFQQIYQNMVSTDLPNWFSLGLIDYLTEKWPFSLQQDLAWFFHEEPKKVKKFSSFAREHPAMAGHSMWHYLAEKYGEQSISDFLYLVRIHNNINKAFQYVFNKDTKQMYEDWFVHYDRYFGLGNVSSPLETEDRILARFEFPITRVLADHSGEYLYYVTNNFGRIQLIKHEISSAKERVVLKYGYKNRHQLIDTHYPLLKINPISGGLGIIYEVKDQLFYREMNPVNSLFEEVLFPEQVQRIFGFEYEKPGFLVFTGSLDGFTDLFLFDLEKRQTAALTENYHDEAEIHSFPFAPGDYYVSANHDSLLLAMESYDSFPPIQKLDIFKVNSSFSEEKKITNTKMANERKPLLNETGDLILLSDADGLYRPYLWSDRDEKYEATGVVPTTKAVLTHDYGLNRYFYVYQPAFNEWAIGSASQVGNLFDSPDNLPVFPGQTQKTTSQEKKFTQDEWIEIDESLLFQTEFDDPEPVSGTDFEETLITQGTLELSSPQKSSELPVFNRSRAVASRLRFNFTELITRVDNQALFEGLEIYDPYNSTYQPPPSGFLVKTTVRDLFEDHVFEGGVRMASDFRGMEYFVTYDYLKRKWDWKYGFYRKSNTEYEDVILASSESEKLKNRTHIALVKAKYPFDTYRSVHLSGSLRFDNTVITASELLSLDVPDFTAQRFLLGVEYIFDNTSEKSANLLSGSRYKVFSRFSNRFNIRLSKPFTFSFSEGVMGLVGFDARHYIDVLKHSTLALRVAGQTSFGSEQNLYFLGGVENWFFSRYDDTYPIPEENDFAFKVQAGNLRGFPYNVRNGSTFLVANAEIRMPVFSYLIGGHIKSSLIRDFQITGFFDSGMAWYGLTLFSEKNTANVFVLEAPPAVVLRIKQIKDPLVGGFGFGVRTSIFGYFLKLDYAWGIENGHVSSPILYFSMGYDF